MVLCFSSCGMIYEKIITIVTLVSRKLGLLRKNTNMDILVAESLLRLALATSSYVTLYQRDVRLNDSAYGVVLSYFANDNRVLLQ
jgi:hypothetical protein